MNSDMTQRHESRGIGPILMVEPRALWRECFEASLGDVQLSRPLKLVSNIADWRPELPEDLPAVVVVSLVSTDNVLDEIERARKAFADMGPVPPVIVMADDEDPAGVLDALDAGANGYVPTSVSIEVAVEAIRLVLAGGTYVPASALLAARDLSSEAAANPEQPCNGMFTERQFAVIERLREGKANKIIAYELNMRESTVKVHIRNIMRKLKATNRTQVAYLYQNMLDEGARGGRRSLRHGGSARD